MTDTPTSRGESDGGLFQAKLFRDFSGTMLWQVLGKLFQVVGMVYATRCLGPDNVGVSRTIITLAMTLQLCLAFGLDAVAVRHVAKGLAKAGEIAPALAEYGARLAGLISAARLTYSKKKTVVVASTKTLADQIVEILEKKYNITIKAARTTRDLGLDAGAGTRRTTAISQGRVKKAVKKLQKTEKEY